jgi:hypothetical protein
MQGAEAAGHLNGFQRYVISRDPGQMTQKTLHVLLHIQRVRHQFTFIVEEEQKVAVSSWAAAANAILLLPDGTIRDPKWRALVPAQGGDAEPEADVPYPAEAWERKARSEAILVQKGMRVLRHLPPVVSEPEVNLRPAQEVAARAMAVLMAALRAESIGGGDPLPLAQLRASFPAHTVELTPEEAEFISQDSPEQKDVVKFSWRYECVFLLEWALCLVPELPFPGHICDVPLTTRTLIEVPPRVILKRARLRGPAEILDAVDLHYRLNWCVRETRRTGDSVPGLDGGVVQERHHALNWLIRFGGSDWDDVDTPT